MQRLSPKARAAPPPRHQSVTARWPNFITRAGVQPRPTKGIAVAMMVMNWTLASSGRLAM
jgi:hypothetical protein